MRRDDLEIFIAIAEQGSLSQAASKLGISVASVSRQLAALEARLGVRLVVKTTRALALTDAGRSYYSNGKRLVTEIEELEAGLVSETEELAGQLVVSSPTLLGRTHVLPLLSRFLADNPGVTMQTLLVDRQVDVLDEGVDVAIVVGELPDSGMVARTLGFIQWGFCASPAYLAERGRPESEEDLKGHDRLVYSRQGVSDSWPLGRSGRKKAMPGRTRLRSNTIDGVVEGALHGVGIAHVPLWAAQHHVATGELELVLDRLMPPPRPVHAVLSHNRLLAAKVRRLCDFLCDQMKIHGSKQTA